MILDTSILIEVLGNNSSVQGKLEKLNERASTTVISEYELLKAPKEESARELLSTLEIYDYDSKAADRAARIFKELRQAGKPINELDIMIASVAAAKDELLVTMDKDFKNVEHLKLLVL